MPLDAHRDPGARMLLHLRRVLGRRNLLPQPGSQQLRSPNIIIINEETIAEKEKEVQKIIIRRREGKKNN